MKTNFRYTKMTVVVFVIIAVVDWFFNGTFGTIGFAITVIPTIVVTELYIKNKNSKPE